MFEIESKEKEHIKKVASNKKKTHTHTNTHADGFVIQRYEETDVCMTKHYNTTDPKHHIEWGNAYQLIWDGECGVGIEKYPAFVEKYNQTKNNNNDITIDKLQNPLQKKDLLSQYELSCTDAAQIWLNIPKEYCFYKSWFVILKYVCLLCLFVFYFFYFFCAVIECQTFQKKIARAKKKPV